MQEGTRVKINLYPEMQTQYPRYYRNFHGRTATVQKPPFPNMPELKDHVLVLTSEFSGRGGGPVYVPKGCCTVVD